MGSSKRSKGKEQALEESENLFQERADCVWFAAKKCPDIASQGIFMEITRQQQGFKSPVQRIAGDEDLADCYQ